MAPRIVDVTLRESVLVEGCVFDQRECADIARGLDDAGIDFIEVGYVDGNPANSGSASGTCPPPYLELMRANIRRAKMSVMVHADKVARSVYPRLKSQGVDMVRFVTIADRVQQVTEHAHLAAELGMNVSINLIRVTEHGSHELMTVADAAKNVGASFLYLADSNGSLYPGRLRQWSRLLDRVRPTVLGIHAHDNLSLAFANTLVALDEGFEAVDSSLCGLGKGGGNLATELVAGHLHREGAGDYELLRLAYLGQKFLARVNAKQHLERYCDRLSGLLNLNVEKLASIRLDARRCNVPIEQKLTETLRPHGNGSNSGAAPASSTDARVRASSDASRLLFELDEMIRERQKMTSRLYQLILSGRAPLRVLQQFVIHRFPIKRLWSRNILGIASRIDADVLRCSLVENIYEEETGHLSGSKRHLETFIEFGEHLGLRREEIVNGEVLPETSAVVEHNLRVCNRPDVHFTEGVASVLLLMEGQPPIVNSRGHGMEAVMRDGYGLPEAGYAFFTHHASASQGSDVSSLEGDHAQTAREILRRYCTEPVLVERAKLSLRQAIDLRHRHFDAIYERYYDPAHEPFRYGKAAHV